ncbi:MAG: phosphatidylserine/phosphatidylglycerophosphate/cardiolipin synthase family protein [Pirellulales bacterium]|nr:phosphatidylserine/phosphatidylglycerophosphate/cardiolipin synthase family protein [Pirellulales bacterium]
MRNADGGQIARRWRRGLAAWCVLLTLVVVDQTARADALRLLSTHIEAGQARIDLVQQARREISLATYTLKYDNYGVAMLSLLRDAARRGVRVRVVMDDYRSHLPDALVAHLADSGVEIRVYHPLTWTRLGGANRRLHDKLLVVDRREAIVGSRNVNDPHYGLSISNFVDRDVYVRGAAANTVQDCFDQLWASQEAAPIEPANYAAEPPDVSPGRNWLAAPAPPAGTIAASDRAAGVRWAAGVLDQGLAVLARGELWHLSTHNDWSAGLSDAGGARFLYDAGGVKQQPDPITTEMIRLIDGAQRSIWLESPYFVPPEAMEAALLRARRRGVAVRLLTNSLASTNVMFAHAGYTNDRPRLLAAGIEIYEYSGPEHFHNKSAVFDERVVIVTSHNFDSRSENLNTEVAIVASDPRLASALLRSIEALLRGADRLGADGVPQGATDPYPTANPARVRELDQLRWPAMLLRRHL